MRRHLLALFYPLALSLTLTAQTATSDSAIPVSMPPAEAIANQALTAFSGGKPVNSVQMNGRARWHYGSDEQAGAAVLIAHSDGQSSMELDLSGGTRKETFPAMSSDPNCEWTDKNGVVHANAAHNCFIPSTWFLPSLAMLSSPAEKSVQLSHLGRETSDSGEVEHLQHRRIISAGSASTKALFDNLGTSDLLLDAQTLLPTVLKFNIHPDNDAGLDIPVEIHYSDYRRINGVNIPFKIEKRVNNNPVLIIDVDSVTVN